MMASRALTEVYVLMRNNAIRNRHIYAAEQDVATEQMSLVELYEDAEDGHVSTIYMPPVWADRLEEAQTTLNRLECSIAELNVLHSRHLHRPTFDESTEEESIIEGNTKEISSMFNAVHRTVRFIKSHVHKGSPRERQLTANVVRSLATSLQDSSLRFRAAQNDYLRKLQSREERSQLYFDTSTAAAIENEYDMLASQSDDIIIDEFFVNGSKQVVQQQQLLYLEEENVQSVEQREQEINSIVHSIIELNNIFKDLSQMVADQGTVLDRIDYNIEQTQTRVYEGFKQLQKADTYQRRNRKMWTIVILAATTIVLFFILVIVKSS